MFGLLKQKNPYEQMAHDMYARISPHIREPAFYKEYAVPDSFDGRYDLLLVHLFIVMQALRQTGDAQADAFNQALFDATFANMDQTLREMGIGDMGVPKHMRKMMKAFNGRMHAYAEALEPNKGQSDLPDVLYRNLYAEDEGVDQKAVVGFAEYVMKQLDMLTARGFEDVVAGDAVFEKP